MAETKRCPRCRNEYPADTEHFYMTKTGIRGYCKVCARALTREWTKKNPGRSTEARRKNPERHAAKQREWRAKNPGKYSEYCKRWYYKHHEAAKEGNRKKYWNKLEMYSAKNRRYRLENPDTITVIKQRRYNTQKCLPATLTVAQWKEIRDSFGGRCAYCGAQGKMQQDHFVPIARGGGYTKDNIIPSCKACNSSKRDRLFSEWYPTYRHYDAGREALIQRQQPLLFDEASKSRREEGTA